MLSSLYLCALCSIMVSYSAHVISYFILGATPARFVFVSKVSWVPAGRSCRVMLVCLTSLHLYTGCAATFSSLVETQTASFLLDKAAERALRLCWLSHTSPRVTINQLLVLLCCCGNVMIFDAYNTWMYSSINLYQFSSQTMKSTRKQCCNNSFEITCINL